MPAFLNTVAYEGGERNAKQSVEPAPHLESPPSVSVPSRLTIVTSGEVSTSLTPSSRTDGSDGSAMADDAGTMSPAQPITTSVSGAAAAVVVPAGAVSPVPVAATGEPCGSVVVGAAVVLSGGSLAARQRRARRRGADQHHDGGERHAAAPPHLVPAPQLVAPPVADRARIGLHHAKLRNASRASPTCSRTSSSARSASPAATASTMRAWSSASAATCSGVSSCLP